MAEFEPAYEITNGNEGGWQNDPHDSGNDDAGHGTYKGLASAKQPRWKGWPIIAAAIAKMPLQPPYGTKPYKEWVDELNATLAANAELQEMVRAYYRLNFWDVNKLDLFRSQEAANKVYDCGVNQGTGTAAMILQKVLGVMPDANIGPVTIAAANRWDDRKLAEAFKQARMVKYQQLVMARPEYRRYLNTWLERC